MPDEMSVDLRWRQDMEFVGAMGSGHEIVMDASPASGGNDRGPRPMEMLLLGLAGCTAMDVIALLKKMRQPVEAYRVQVRGVRREDYPRYFTHITIEHVVTGDVAEDRLAHAVELSEDKYCSAQAMLRELAEIEVRYRVERP